ncbi:MAG: hypothetical protein H3C38_04555 [Rhodospirillales bacterium]|nr:hypothetical protein [Rhodospirillales bacterium]
MRDSVGPDDGGRGAHKSPRVRAVNAWYVFLALFVAFLVGALFLISG